MTAFTVVTDDGISTAVFLPLALPPEIESARNDAETLLDNVSETMAAKASRS